MSTPSGHAGASVQTSDASLVDLLDRVLQRGVVLKGDILLSVADVDLVRLSVSLLLAAEDTAAAPRPAASPSAVNTPAASGDPR